MPKSVGTTDVTKKEDFPVPDKRQAFTAFHTRQGIHKNVQGKQRRQKSGDQIKEDDFRKLSRTSDLSVSTNPQKHAQHQRKTKRHACRWPPLNPRAIKRIEGICTICFSSPFQQGPDNQRSPNHSTKPPVIYPHNKLGIKTETHGSQQYVRNGNPQISAEGSSPAPL